MSTWMYASINRSLTVKDFSKFAHNSRNHVTFSIQSDDGTVSLTRWHLLPVLSDVDAPITGLPQPWGLDNLQQSERQNRLLDNLQQSERQNMRRAPQCETETLHPCFTVRTTEHEESLTVWDKDITFPVSNKTPNKHTQNQSIYRNQGWFCSLSYPISLPVFSLSSSLLPNQLTCVFFKLIFTTKSVYLCLL